MASSRSTVDAELSQLTPSQRDALHQFTAVTDQQPAAALPLLRRCQWNVQIAIAKFFDGETADPVAEALAAQASAATPSSSTTARPPTSASSSSSRRTSHRRHSDITPAPRIVPTPSSTLVRRSILLTILFFPFSLLYKLLSSSFHAFTIIFPFLRPLQRSFSGGGGATSRRRQPTNPRDTAARFIREFEESTGIKDLPWFEGGYAQAMDLAKQDVRIMMVVLQSEEHDDTHVFNKETLGNTEIVKWIRDQNIVLWGGSVSDAEGYQVSASLTTTAFPFLALISLTPPPSSTSSSSPNGGGSTNPPIPTTMSTILRITGLLPPQTLLTKLNTALSAHATSLSRLRALRETHLADRQIRAQQNSAYELSLARDRERARLRREEDARRKQAEDDARRKVEAAQLALRRRMAWRRRQVRLGLLPREPPVEVKAARVSVRFPDGEKVIRRFERETGMERVYAWVECRGVDAEAGAEAEGAEGAEQEEEEEKLLKGYVHTYTFRLVNPFPRRVFEAGEAGGTVGEVLWPSGNLIVEEVEEEEEGEGEVEAGVVV